MSYSIIQIRQILVNLYVSSVDHYLGDCLYGTEFYWSLRTHIGIYQYFKLLAIWYASKGMK
jgi:hypothetical protein